MDKPGKMESKSRSDPLQRAYAYLAARPYSIILLAAIAYNIFAKLFWAYRLQLKGEFYLWILSDIAMLAGIEVVFAIVCYYRQKRGTIRMITFIAALVCTWSVINAAWLRRTGTQVLPGVMLPVFRAPGNSFRVVGSGLALMPVSAVIILGGSAILLSRYKPDYRPSARRPERALIDRLTLHAGRITCEHPVTGTVLTLEAPLPKDFRATLTQLARLV